jgi:hypothetical protein
LTVKVFPGGNYDEQQDESLALTAIRETFEESGLLMASSLNKSIPDEAILNKARIQVHSQNLAFQTFLSEHQLKADVSSLLPFTQWITPESVARSDPYYFIHMADTAWAQYIIIRRFQTQFFITFLPSAPSAGFYSGDNKERIPTSDGGQEVVSARFLHPTDALSAFAVGGITLFPPQFYLISTLRDILNSRQNTKLQRDQVSSLSRGAFGSVVITPRLLPEPDEQGYNILAFDGDETRGGSKGRLHRVLTRTKVGSKVGNIFVLGMRSDMSY